MCIDLLRKGMFVDMLKISLFEFFFRVIPEEIILFFSIYLFSFKSINVNKIFISGLLGAVMTSFVRSLPIQNGVHTFVLIPIFVLIAVFYNNISLKKSISVNILVIIIMFACELLSSYILIELLNVNVTEVFQDVVKRTIYSYISLVFYLLIIIVCYFTLYKKKIKNVNSNGYKI
ncbi:MAG: hypothetical protein AB6733_02235 [Clostridiaceae bacterium]